MDYILGDTHFNHEKMRELRGYSTLDEMNKDITDKINSVISDKYDTLIINGDVSFANKTKTKEILSKVNGYKILIVGNHDRRKSKVWWHDVGFDDVIYGSLLRDNVIISHEPVDNLPDGYYNIHAHIHDRKSKYDNDNRYFCTSIEQVDKPVMLRDLIFNFKTNKEVNNNAN